MLSLGSLHSFDCGRVTRRAAMSVGSLGVLHLTLADFLRMQALAAENAPRAKSVILLWLWGGPSHLDTFDMKPKAPVQYRGPYAPIATRRRFAGLINPHSRHYLFNQKGFVAICLDRVVWGLKR